MSGNIRSCIAALVYASMLSSAACKSTEQPEPQIVIAKTAGDQQSAAVNQPLPIELAVTVTRGGNPESGVSINFTVTSGGGTINKSFVTTDDDGIARVFWTLGSLPGLQTLSARQTNSSEAPLIFTANAVTFKLTKLAGDQQNGTVGRDVAIRPSVRVTNQNSDPVEGTVVTFTTAPTGGSVTGDVVTTNSDGVATVGAWTLGTTPGAQSLTVRVGVTSVTTTFVASAAVGAPSSVTKIAGDGQSAVVGTAVVTKPAIKVLDPFGNPIVGHSVTFTVTGGNGTITGAETVTGSDGVARVGSWTLGPTPGPNTLSARAAGNSLVRNPSEFTATGLVTGAVKAGQPSSLNPGSK